MSVRDESEGGAAAVADAERVVPATIADDSPSALASPSHSISLLRDGREAYPAWLEAIAAARSEILLEMYWFGSDATGARFAKALAERARAGVVVYVLYDGIGSLGVDPAQWDMLRAAGARVIEFHPVYPLAERFALAKVQQRDHRKILVVDASVAFTGGINICDENLPREEGGRGWRDDAVRVTGEAVLELRALFFDSWLRVGVPPAQAGAVVGWRVRRALTAAACEQCDASEDNNAFAKTMDSAMDLVRIATSRRRRKTRARAAARERAAQSERDARLRPRIIGHDSWGATRTIRNLYVRKIESAQRVILIANSYFAPDLPVRRALIGAALRGVEVRVMVPRDSDVKAVAWAGRALYAGLMRAGVHVHEWTESMLHSKTAVIDGWATVGSYNLDYRSLRYNLEVNAASEDPTFVAQVESALRADLAKSVQVQPDAWAKRPWWQRLLEWGFYLFRKIL
jgi:cardiolipin synthase